MKRSLWGCSWSYFRQALQVRAGHLTIRPFLCSRSVNPFIFICSDCWVNGYPNFKWIDTGLKNLVVQLTEPKSKGQVAGSKCLVKRKDHLGLLCCDGGQNSWAFGDPFRPIHLVIGLGNVYDLPLHGSRTQPVPSILSTANPKLNLRQVHTLKLLVTISFTF